MRTSWIVQTNVEPESPTPHALQRACAALGLPFFEISVAAGAASLPRMPEVEGPVVLHGRTTLILRALEHPRWRRGMFFDPGAFQHRMYAAHYGPRMLNASARVVRWDDLFEEAHSPEDRFFLKPNDDLKRFTGGVFSLAEARTLYEARRAGGAPFAPNEEVVLSHPREIDGEWRVFLVGGRAVSASMYRPTGDPNVPREVLSFAEETASIWAPSPVFVLDVARADGDWWVVECNCFNGSRFYLADVERVVDEVSTFQEARE